MPEPVTVTWLQYVDTALLVAVGGGTAHVLMQIGSMRAKIDAMWEWWIKNDPDEREHYRDR